MRRLLDGLIPGLSETAAEKILERAEGIPLYAVETVRMLVQEGRLEAIDGGYRPIDDLGDVAVPSSLHALIAARLDALDARERELLQALSVLGKTFSVEAAAAVAGDDAAAIEPRLRDLVRRELLVIDADPRSPERGQYGYLQGLMREVAYSTLARRDRRRLHLAAAQHFETIADDELSGILATHYIAAFEAQPEGPEGEAVGAQARVALRAAADRAGRLGSWGRAYGYLRQALVVTHEPSERADLLEAAAVAARHSAQHELAVESAREALDLRRSIGDRRKVIAASALLGRVLVTRGVLEPAREFLEQSAEEFGDDIDSAEYVALAGPLTQILMRMGEDERCIELSDRLLPVAERHGPLDATLEILINRGTALLNLNRVVEGAATLVGAIDIARLNEMPVVELRAIVNLSLAGDLDEPRITQNLRGLELIERYGLRSYLMFMLNNYTEEAMARGAWSDAIARIDAFAETALTETEREQLRLLPIDLLTLRGEARQAEVDRAYASVKDLVDDPQVVAARYTSDQRLALAEGRLADVVDLGVSAGRGYPGMGVAPIADAGHAAIRLGDADRARAIRAEIAERPGRMVANHLRALDAGIAAVDGRMADAIQGFREACAIWDEVGLKFWLAMTQLTMISVLHLAPSDLRNLGEAARGQFEAIGAAPLVHQVEETLAARARESDRPPSLPHDASATASTSASS